MSPKQCSLFTAIRPFVVFWTEYIDPTRRVKSMDNDTLIELHQRLVSLRLEHRDLDDAIAVLEQNTYVDQLQLRRMKKRKLQLKDAMARLESRLIPDLNA